MQKVSNVRKLLSAAAVMVVCAMLCLSLGGAFAWAEGDESAGGNNALEVYVALGEDDDLTGVNIPVTLYKIASYTKDPKYDTYNFTFDIDPFTELGSKYKQETMDGEQWQNMADDAKKLVEQNSLTPSAQGTTAINEDKFTLASFDGLGDGIYLMLLDEDSSNQAYNFIPTIVSLPGKVDENSAVYETSQGRWTNTDPVVPVQVFSKHEGKPGNLIINKVVTEEVVDQATFVFHVYDIETEGARYDQYVAMQYEGGGEISATLSNIPAGLELAVEEIYEGGRFEVVGDRVQQVLIKPGEDQSVGFVNERRDGPSGHGIENRYTFDGESGDWIIEPRVFDATESRPVS